jgi:hypothetical protein
MSSFAVLLGKKRKAKQIAEKEKEAKILKLSQHEPEEATHNSSKVKNLREANTCWGRLGTCNFLEYFNSVRIAGFAGCCRHLGCRTPVSEQR